MVPRGFVVVDAGVQRLDSRCLVFHVFTAIGHSPAGKREIFTPSLVKYD